MESLLEEAKRLLFDISPHIMSIGLGFKVTKGETSNTACIVVGIDKKLDPVGVLTDEMIPSRVLGMVTDVVEVGVLRALAFDPKARHRPAPGGSSVGNVNITAGTMGPLVKHGEEIMLLSNWHVLCAGDSPGVTIVQPGVHDGGDPGRDRIGELFKAVPIQFEDDLETECPIANMVAASCNFLARLTRRQSRLMAYAIPEAAPNLVDAAIARIDQPLVKMVDNRIAEIGVPVGIAEAELGMAIQKYGRTTEYTEGSILQTNVSVRVQYGEGRVALMEDQLMAGAMSAGGDSGSAVLNSEKNVVGLLFAGSDTTTILNRIQNVFDLLEITLIRM